MRIFVARLLAGFAGAQSRNSTQTDPDEACKPYVPAVAYFTHPSSVEHDFGTGFLISSDGLIATAAHVVIPKPTNPSTFTTSPQSCRVSFTAAKWMVCGCLQDPS